jgi:hypothetical protein
VIVRGHNRRGTDFVRPHMVHSAAGRNNRVYASRSQGRGRAADTKGPLL